MSKSVHPYAHRLGILRDWRSRWFTRGKSYRDQLQADVLMREYLEKKLRGFYVDSVEMERGRNSLRIMIMTSRPGMIIGRNGEGSTKLKGDILALLAKIKADIPKEVKLDIQEVRSPESHARIVGHMITEQLEKRMPFRRVIKQTAEKVMANRDVKGVRISLSGRLDGAEMGRFETIKRGQVPLTTFRADIDFAREKAHLPYGDIGIKVWIYRGEIFAEKNKERAKTAKANEQAKK
ncbi:MAG TPA: 30S ribosomal protein S3 [Candidatus Paceibacterota bacterium]